MQIIGKNGEYNPANNNGNGSFPTGTAAAGGKMLIHNYSPYELILQFNNDPTREAILSAWQPRLFDFCGKQTQVVGYSVPMQPPAAVIQNAPYSFIWAETFIQGEPTPVSLPNYDRISNVGNTVTTQGGSANVKNDGNSPGTSIVEATPSDQTQSSVQINNDASGFAQILSAGVLKSIWNFVRGNNSSTKAALTIGDSTDTSIMTVYGTLGAGSVVPGSLVSGAVATANAVAASGIVGTLLASQVGTGYPGSYISGAVASATAASTATNATNATNAQMIQTTTDSGSQYSNIWLTTTTPASPGEGDLWFLALGTLTDTWYGPTGTPNYSYNDYNQTHGIQMWVEWNPPANGTIIGLKIYGAGASGAVLCQGAVWSSSGTILGYDTGSGVSTSGGGASIGGQSWSGTSAQGSPASVFNGTTYKVGFYINNQSNTFAWSMYQAVQSPFTSGQWGYQAPSANGVNQNLSGTNWTASGWQNNPVTIQVELQTGGTSHIYYYHNSGWVTVL